MNGFKKWTENFYEQKLFLNNFKSDENDLWTLLKSETKKVGEQKIVLNDFKTWTEESVGTETNFERF